MEVGEMMDPFDNPNDWSEHNVTAEYVQHIRHGMTDKQRIAILYRLDTRCDRWYGRDVDPILIPRCNECSGCIAHTWYVQEVGSDQPGSR